MKHRKQSQVEVNAEHLRIELARKQVTKAQLASMLGESPTTLGSWLRHAHPGPDNLAARIEEKLGLAVGTLAVPVTPAVSTTATGAAPATTASPAIPIIGTDENGGGVVRS